MYRFAVYDSNSERKEKILLALKAVLHEKGITKFSYMCIDSLDSSNLWPIQAEDNNMVFVSSGMPNSVKFANSIYRKNPFCKIIYYGKIELDINELLKFRPIAVFKGNFRELKSLLKFELFENDCGTNAIFFETRVSQVVLPVKNTIYFSSQQHYIYVISDKDFFNERFRGKLDDLQKSVSERFFMRIHKSYLISLLHFSKLDKKEHLVIMDNGDKLPISDFYYKDVLKKIRDFCPLEA